MVHVDLLGTVPLVALSKGSALSARARFIENVTTGLASSAVLSPCSANVQFDIQVPNHPIYQLVVDLVKSLFAKRLNSDLCNELASLVDGDLTNVLRSLNSAMEPFLFGRGPPAQAPDYGGAALNFTGNPFFGMVDFLLDDLIGANGPFGVNLILGAITNHTGRLAIDFPDQGRELGTFAISSLGNVTLGIRQLSLSGLDSFSKLQVFVPHDSYSLDSELSMSEFGLNVSFFVNTSLNSGGAIEGQSLFETGVLRFSAGNLTVGLDVAAGINAYTATSLSFGQLLSGGCLKATIMGGNVTQARLNFALQQLVVQAISNGGQLEGSLDAVIDNLLLLFVSSFNSVIPAFVNAVLLTPGVMAANNAIVHDVFEKLTPCELAPGKDAYSSSYPLNPIASLIVLVCATVVWIGVSAVMCVLHCVKYGDHANEPDQDDYTTSSTTDDDKHSVFNASGERVQLLSVRSSTHVAPQAYDPGSFGILSLSQRSRAASGWKNQPASPTGIVPIGLDPQLWWILKLAIPFLIIGNIGLFIVSNVSIGASVFVYFHLGSNHTISSSSLFSFTLSNSVHDMWVAGVYPLSLVIAIFSGTWPYIKLLAMLAVWLFPIKSKLRENILIVLDMMGKWSLIDAFVLVFMMVAFRFNLVIPGSALAHTETGDAKIDLLVEAGLGFYVFLLATMFSLALTHVILATHRWLEEKRDVEEVAGSELGVNAEIVFKSDRRDTALAVFQLEHILGDGSVVKASLFGTLTIAVLLIVSFGLVVGGAVVHSFVFHFRGAAGALFPYAGVENDRYFSLVSLALELPQAALTPDGFGVRWVQATLLVFSLAVPLAYLFMLFVLWMIPMKKLLQGRLFVLTEILRAWSAMEVFVLAVIAALTELEQFAQFLVGDRCDFINPILERFFSFLLDGDAKCFDVTTSLVGGCWLMFSACLIYIFTGQVVMSLVHEAIFPKLSEKETRSRLVRFLLWCKLAEER